MAEMGTFLISESLALLAREIFYFLLLIHRSIFASSTASGSEPSRSTTLWNSRTSKREPSAACALLRSSRMRSWPIL